MKRDIKHIGKQITFRDEFRDECGYFPHTMLKPGDLLVYGDSIVRGLEGSTTYSTTIGILENIESINKSMTNTSSMIQVGSFAGWTKSKSKGLVELTSISSDGRLNKDNCVGWKRDKDVPSDYKNVDKGLDTYWHISEGETWTLVGYADETPVEKEYEVSLEFLKQGYKQAPQEIKEKLLTKFKDDLNAEKEYFTFGRDFNLSTSSKPLMIANCFADPEIGEFKELIVLDGYEVIVSELEDGHTRIKLLKRYK